MQTIFHNNPPHNVTGVLGIAGIAHKFIPKKAKEVMNGETWKRDTGQKQNEATKTGGRGENAFMLLMCGTHLDGFSIRCQFGQDRQL